MSKSFAAPRTIRRIAARRVFKAPSGKPVVVTLAVPQAVPGSDWGCALQITGLNTTWRRPRYVFGIDGLQALQLAMQCAGAVLESTMLKLEWLGQHEDLGMPSSDHRTRGDQVGAPRRARSPGEAFEAAEGTQAIESSRQVLTMRQGPNHAVVWS
jgi:hypothetical protein